MPERKDQVRRLSHVTLGVPDGGIYHYKPHRRRHTQQARKTKKTVCFFRPRKNLKKKRRVNSARLALEVCGGSSSGAGNNAEPPISLGDPGASSVAWCPPEEAATLLGSDTRRLHSRGLVEHSPRDRGAWASSSGYSHVFSEDGSRYGDAGNPMAGGVRPGGSPIQAVPAPAPMGATSFEGGEGREMVTRTGDGGEFGSLPEKGAVGLALESNSASVAPPPLLRTSVTASEQEGPAPRRRRASGKHRPRRRKSLSDARVQTPKGAAEREEAARALTKSTALSGKLGGEGGPQDPKAAGNNKHDGGNYGDTSAARPDDARWVKGGGEEGDQAEKTSENGRGKKREEGWQQVHEGVWDAAEENDGLEGQGVQGRRRVMADVATARLAWIPGDPCACAGDQGVIGDACRGWLRARAGSLAEGEVRTLNMVADWCFFCCCCCDTYNRPASPNKSDVFIKVVHTREVMQTKIHVGGAFLRHIWLNEKGRLAIGDRSTSWEQSFVLSTTCCQWSNSCGVQRTGIP